MNEQEQAIFQIISSAGDSKAKAFEALAQVKDGNYEKARILLTQAKKMDVEAHKIQTKLIQQEMNQDQDAIMITLLMVHAQDHYMTSQLARDLIETLVDVFEAKEVK